MKIISTLQSFTLVKFKKILTTAIYRPFIVVIKGSAVQNSLSDEFVMTRECDFYDEMSLFLLIYAKEIVQAEIGLPDERTEIKF